jgi:hypothetical protein
MYSRRICFKTYDSDYQLAGKFMCSIKRIGSLLPPNSTDCATPSNVILATSNGQ